MLKKIEAFSRALAPNAAFILHGIADLCDHTDRVRHEHKRIYQELTIANMPRIDPYTSEEIEE